MVSNRRIIRELRYSVEGNELLDCLRNDDIKIFTNKFNIFHKLIKEYAQFKTLLSFVLLFNTDEIAYFCAKRYGVTFKDFNILTNKYNHRIDKGNITKLMLNFCIFSKMSNVEIEKIINTFARIDCWSLVDYFHIQNFRANDRESLMYNVPKYKIAEMLRLGYKMNEGCLLNLIKDGSIESNEIKSFFDKMEIVNIKKYELQLIKSREPEFVKSIIEKYNSTFKFTDKHLDIACVGRNFPMIRYLLDLKIKFTKNSFNKLIDKKKLYSTIWVTRRGDLVAHNGLYRRRRRIAGGTNIGIYSQLKLIDDYNRKLGCCPEYEKEIIDLFKNYPKVKPVNSLYLWSLVVGNNYFNLADYLIEKGLKCKLSSFVIIRRIKDLILEDNIEIIKKLLSAKLINLNEVSSKPELMNTAILNNATKTVDYFHNTLKMKCTNAILNYLAKMRCRYSYKFTGLYNVVTCLIKIGFPLNDKLMTIACKSNDLKTVEFLYENKIEGTRKHIETALVCYNIRIVKFLLKQKCKYTKRNLVDRILKYYEKFYYRFDERIILNVVKFAHNKLKGTATHKCLHFILYSQHTKLLQYAIENLNITIPDDVSVCSILAMNPYNRRDRRRRYRNINNDYMAIDDCKFGFIKYIHEELNVKISLPSDIISEQIKTLMMNSDLNLLKYIAEKTNYVFTNNDLYNFIRFYSDYYCSGYENIGLETFKYIESKGVIPTEPIFMYAVLNNALSILEYLFDKYKFNITLKIFNDYVSNNWITVKMLTFIIDVLKIKPTPYSIELYLDRGRHTFYDDYSSKILPLLLQNTIGVTLESYNLLNSSLQNKKLLEKVNIVEYEPVEEEIINENVNELDIPIENNERIDEVQRIINEENNDDNIGDDPLDIDE